MSLAATMGMELTGKEDDAVEEVERGGGGRAWWRGAAREEGGQRRSGAEASRRGEEGGGEAAVGGGRAGRPRSVEAGRERSRNGADDREGGVAAAVENFGSLTAFSHVRQESENFFQVLWYYKSFSKFVSIFF
jgi:hypothetical protein